MTDKNIGNKQIAKNIIFQMFSFGINMAISLLFTPYLIKTLGNEVYGFFPLTNNIIGYSSIISIAITSMAGRFIIMQLYNGDKYKAQVYFNSVIAANIVLSIFFTFIATILVLYLNSILNIPNGLLSDVQWLFALTFLCTIVALPVGVFSVGTHVKNRLDLNSYNQLINNVIRIVFILILFYLFKPNLIFIGISAFLASIFSVGYSVHLRKKLLPEFEINIRRYYSWAAIKTLLSSGMWNSLNQLSIVLLNQVDLLITNIFISAVATSEFAIAKTMPHLILSMLTVLSGSFLPTMNILYARGEKESLLVEINKSIKVVGLIIGIPIGLLLVFGESFFNLWVPGQDSEKLFLLSGLTLVPMIIGCSVNPLFGVFSITNKLRIPSIVLLISGVLNTAIIFVLLKLTNLGIWAIPITSAFQMIIRNGLFTTIYGAKCLNIRWSYFFPAMLKCILCITFIVIVSSIIHYLNPIDSWIAFVYSCALATVISFLININIMFKRKERISIINKVKQRFRL